MIAQKKLRRKSIVDKTQLFLFEDFYSDASLSELKDVFDKIIDAFTVKRRKAIFDQERDVAIVDFEESRSQIIQFISIVADFI